MLIFFARKLKGERRSAWLAKNKNTIENVF